MRELFIKRDRRKEIDQLVNMKMLLTMLMMPMKMTMMLLFGTFMTMWCGNVVCCNKNPNVSVNRCIGTFDQPLYSFYMVSALSGAPEVG